MHSLMLILLLAFLIPTFAANSNAATACPAQREIVGTTDVRRECDKKTGLVTKEEWGVPGTHT